MVRRIIRLTYYSLRIIKSTDKGLYVSWVNDAVN